LSKVDLIIHVHTI